MTPRSFVFTRAVAVFRKEVRHILRDPFTLAFACGFPILLLIFFGLAIDFNVRNVGISYYDGNRSPKSRELVRIFESSGYFNMTGKASPSEVLAELQSEKVKAGMIIRRDHPNDVQFLIDGADNTTASVVVSYLGALRQSASPRFLEVTAPRPPLEIRTRFLFNPELNSRWFVVPGLAVVIIAILSILLTSLTVAREWENGSMELLLSTPLHPLEIVLGKIAPYTILCMASFALVYLTARLGFGVPFRGSHLLFGAGCLLFVSSYLAQGLLISVVIRSQQLSMQVAMVSGLLPSLLLSGFIFPIENMPIFFQYLTGIMPARWFMIISRGTFLKDSGLLELAVPFSMLFLLNLLLVTVAVKKFKRDLEP